MVSERVQRRVFVFAGLFWWSLPDPFDTFFIHIFAATECVVVEKGVTLAFYAHPPGLG